MMQRLEHTFEAHILHMDESTNSVKPCFLLFIMRFYLLLVFNLFSLIPRSPYCLRQRVPPPVGFPFDDSLLHFRVIVAILKISYKYFHYKILSPVCILGSRPCVSCCCNTTIQTQWNPQTVNLFGMLWTLRAGLSHRAAQEMTVIIDHCTPNLSSFDAFMTELRLVFDQPVQSGEEYTRLFCSRFSIGRCQFNSVSNICSRQWFHHSEVAMLSRSSKGACCDRVANSLLSKIAPAVLGLVAPLTHVHPSAPPPAKPAVTHLHLSSHYGLTLLTSIIPSGWNDTALWGGFVRGLNEQLRDKH